MPNTAQRNPTPGEDTGLVRHVLVVDDSRAQRMVLSASLKRWGYAVTEAASGAEALDICRDRPVDMVLSDWVMPGIDGLEFCRRFRGLPREGYGYFILLTSKSEKAAVALGLEAGADDFLTKPVAPDELRARIAAGERILRMERELSEKNRLVSSALAEIRQLYDALDRDLAEARNLQQSLVRDRQGIFPGAEISLLLRPSGHVGGDLVGYFPVGGTRVGIFSLDVSGHGVASALLTARLAGLLSSAAPDQCIALERNAEGRFSGRQPADVARRLNAILLNEIETDQYLTLLYAILDLDTGGVEMVQAGHPHPAVQRADGRLETVGHGGMPIGLLADADYETVTLRLHPGDRMLLLSDGITECARNGEELGEAGLRRMMNENRALGGARFLEALTWDLADYAGTEDFSDDVSAALVEYSGSAG
ncbi:MAG: SpoIIE family protein phosphatase [Paracoccaceae bacterium]